MAITFERLGFKELYIADLNSITDNQDNFAAIAHVAKQTGLQIMVDAGIADIKKAKIVRDCGASKIIIGTETLTDVGFIQQAITSFGSDHVVVSFDMKEGQFLGKFDVSSFSDPIDVLSKFQRMGVTQTILLDLARVGSQEGVDRIFLGKVLSNVSMQIFVGGGVCDIIDLVRLNEMGIAGALIATALHSGKITIEQIQHAGLLS